MALLIQAVINDPKILRSVLLIPDQWPTLIELIKNFAWMFVSMFWRTPNHADFNIARLPILNIMELVLIFFGIYALASKKRRITYLLVFFMLTSFLFAAINGSLYILSLALPPIAVFFAAGIRYLYLEWRQVFPINPFAKGLALGLILLVVVSQLLYVGRYSLIAWPHTTDTKNTYVLK
ncbi:MAG TPA: hypothetical protein VFB03_01730 [Candidatus Saccharimonadales bacterium]|nr:hypothetical protein [Candidatus Saccharimonadales bacterium]